MKHTLLACLLVLGTVGAMNPNAASSDALADRLDRAEARISDGLTQNAINAGQAKLFRAGIAAIKAVPAGDASASAMLDELDRDLAMHDFVLGGAEDGMHVVVRVGQSITVAMHDNRQWSFTVSDTSVVANPRIGVMWMRGVQGVFTALKPGAASIQLQGRNAQAPGAIAHATNVRLVNFFITVVAP